MSTPTKTTTTTTTETGDEEPQREQAWRAVIVTVRPTTALHAAVLAGNEAGIARARALFVRWADICDACDANVSMSSRRTS